MVSDESTKLPAEKETHSVSKKKRKKNKAKGVDERNLIEKIEHRANNQDRANANQNDKIKKTKKRKKAKNSNNKTTIDNECINSNNHDLHYNSPPSKIPTTNNAKAGNTEDQSLENSQNNQTTSHSTKKKKRKKAGIKTDTDECSVKQNEFKETEDKLSIKTKKKKKKQRIDKEEKQRVITKENDASQNNTQPERKKAKSDENSEILTTTTSNKKKKKKMKYLSMENASSTDQQQGDNEEKIGTNSVTKVGGDGENKSPKKKKKAKKRKNELEIETDHKEGQTQDEISTPVKKKVKESGVLICDQNQKESHLDLGQWKTAELANSSQQEKFNRLLGGLKSKKKETTEKTDGNQSVLSRLSGVHKPTGKLLWGKRKADNGGYSTMAMNAEQSKKLAGKLEEQFQDTLQFNLQKMKEGNKAKGFGFQEDPSFGKKHHIDKFKRNSVLLE